MTVVKYLMLGAIALGMVALFNAATQAEEAMDYSYDYITADAVTLDGVSYSSYIIDELQKPNDRH